MKNYYLKPLLSAVITSLAMAVLSGCQTMPQDNNQVIAQNLVVTDEVSINELIKYNWHVISAVSADKKQLTEIIQLQKPAYLNFRKQGADLNYNFGVGCNHIGGSAKLLNGSLTSGVLMKTLVYCESLNKAESKLADLMSTKSQLTITNSNTNKNDRILKQVTADGSTLIWQGKLTDVAQHGKGETIFLEIDAKTQHCSSGINQQCLKVREIYYDKNWIKSGASDWKLMKQPIEGYSHNSNNHNILRVKKYITQPVDVKGKQLKYVLDMVVETSMVK